MQTERVVDHASLVERYVALWNEADAEKRKKAIAELWDESGGHVAPTIVVRGYEELEARVERAHQRWVVEEQCRFRSRGDVGGHHNVIRFTWEMTNREGSVESVGTDVFVLDDAGKIRCVYQFVER
jgi:SnoaL-like domain